MLLDHFLLALIGRIQSEKRGCRHVCGERATEDVKRTEQIHRVWEGTERRLKDMGMQEELEGSIITIL